MAKPTELGEWATNPGQTIEPDSDQKAMGFNEGDKPPARWINWLWNIAHQWNKYTNNLHAEPEFLNKDYPWEGKHSFSQAIQGDLKLTGEVLYDETKVRHMILPLTRFQPQTMNLGTPYVSEWHLTDYEVGPSLWSTSRDNDVLVGHFRLPSGTIPVALNSWVLLATGAEFRLRAERLRYVTEGTPTKLPTVDEVTVSLDVAAGPWDAVVGSFLDGSKTFNANTDLLRVRLDKGVSSGGSGATCEVYWVDLMYQEIGPHY